MKAVSGVCPPRRRRRHQCVATRTLPQAAAATDDALASLRDPKYMRLRVLELLVDGKTSVETRGCGAVYFDDLSLEANLGRSCEVTALCCAVGRSGVRL